MPELAIHPFLSFLPQQSEMRENDISQKINALAVSPYLDLVRMKLKLKPLAQEILYRLQKNLQLRRIVAHNQKVVSITDIVFNMQSMLHKLIKFVQIDIGKKLAREIADRHSFSRYFPLSLSLSRKPAAW